MDTDLTVTRNGPRRVRLVVPQRKQRRTALARKRRLNSIIRTLARDLGFDADDVTLAERGILTQLGAMLLQVELNSDALIRGGLVDPDITIRLTSEARRLLAGLRRRTGHDGRTTQPAWSPLRAQLEKAALIGSSHDD